ncbi:MAG: nucleotide exchange factor GrpE [Anaerovoracaceae bacterium]|jgi:molecular chaperone GrpE
MTKTNEENIKDKEIDIEDAKEGEKEDEKEKEQVEETGQGKDAESEDEDKEEKAEEKSDDEDIQTKYLRLMADFQNFKKRAEKERADIHAFANEKIVVQLLEVMDNFERALGHDSDDKFKEGMTMIFDQLKDVLTKSGVEEIEAEAATFDPNFHNAVMMEETDKVESGQVSEVLQKGYTMNGRVIRPSMVKVAQ